MILPRAGAGRRRREGAGIGRVAQLDPVLDAVPIPIRIPLRAVRVPQERGDVAVRRRRVRNLGIGVVSEFLDIEPPVVVRVLGGIMPVARIEPFGDLPNVAHAVAIIVELIVEIRANVEPEVVFLDVAHAVVIGVPALVQRVERVHEPDLLHEIGDAAAIRVGEIGLVVVGQAIGIGIILDGAGAEDAGLLGVGEIVEIGVLKAGLGAELGLDRVPQAVAIGIEHIAPGAPVRFEPVVRNHRHTGGSLLRPRIGRGGLRRCDWL